MHALPIVIVHFDNVELIEGALVKLPPELRSKSQLDFYATRCLKGWNTCPQGYAVYCESDDGGRRFLAPGLIISDVKRPAKKVYSNPITFTKAQIADFVTSLRREYERIQKAKDDELSVLI